MQAAESPNNSMKGAPIPSKKLDSIYALPPPRTGAGPKKEKAHPMSPGKFPAPGTRCAASTLNGDRRSTRLKPRTSRMPPEREAPPALRATKHPKERRDSTKNGAKEFHTRARMGNSKHRDSDVKFQAKSVPTAWNQLIRGDQSRTPTCRWECKPICPTQAERR